ncbi:tetratricopeptide repeat protein [Niveispirillum lacus]|nr:tetratricopeptide repeat protein [Niveispirillum lacus]
MDSHKKSRSLYNLGLQAHKSEDFSQARELYGQVLSMMEPDELALRMSLINLAAINLEDGQYQEAGNYYRTLLKISPNDVAALNGLGLIAQSQHDWDAAVASYRLGITLAPDNVDLHTNLGICLTTLRRFDEARVSLENAVRLQPDATGFFNLGRLHENAGRLNDAVACYDHALALKPNMVGALIQRGITLHVLGRDADAITDLEQALKIETDSAKAAWNLSLCLLREGRYEEGWRQFEARWCGHGGMAAGSRNFNAPQWRGDPNPDGCLLIHTEQGMGDTLQMARYIPMAAEAFQGKVVVEAQNSLVRLLESSFSRQSLHIVERAADFPGSTGLPPFTTHVPIASLPGIFKTTLSTVPNQTPYLRPPTAEQEQWAARIMARRGTLRVGLVWQGNPDHHNDQNRSIPVSALEPLLSIPGIAWFLLQKYMRPQQSCSLASRPGVTDLGPLLNDFADTAAALGRLDLVISVDTSVAHLAGACKRPTWVLLGWPSDWRWLRDRTSSPWYPTATLFRQQQSGDWGPVIALIERRLRILTGF